MGEVIGTLDWRLSKGAWFDERKHLAAYLRYALQADPGITRVTVRHGCGDYTIDSRIVSRLEVALAWEFLRKREKRAVYLRIVEERPPLEVALVMGCSIRTVQRLVQAGLKAMVERVYEREALAVGEER